MPKNSKKNQGQKKLQLSNKQFDDLLKEIGGGLPEGLALDPTLLAALRQATNDQFNVVAKEKFGDIPQESDDDEMEEQQGTSEKSNDQPQSSSVDASKKQ